MSGPSDQRRLHAYGTAKTCIPSSEDLKPALRVGVGELVLILCTPESALAAARESEHPIHGVRQDPPSRRYGQVIVSVVQPLSVSRDARGPGRLANFGNEPARSRCGGQCCGGLRSRRCSGPSGIDRRARGRVVGLVGSLPTLQRGIRGRGQSATHPAVLKLLIPQDGPLSSTRSQRCDCGGQAVGLLRDDAARGRCSWSASALSLRSGPHSPNAGDTGDAAVTCAARGSGLPTGADKARQLVDFVTTHGRAWPSVPRRPSSTPWPARHGAELHTTTSGPYWCMGRSPVNALQVPGRELQACRPDDCSRAECDLG